MNVKASIDEKIKEYGHTVMHVFGNPDGPDFSYTIGLTETYGHPELLVFALPGESATLIVNDIVQKIKLGAILLDGAVLDDVANLPLTIKAVSPGAGSHYAFQALYRYKGKSVQPQFLQLVLCDRAGKFPWQEGFAESMKGVQPELWNRQEEGEK